MRLCAPFRYRLRSTRCRQQTQSIFLYLKVRRRPQCLRSLWPNCLRGFLPFWDVCSYSIDPRQLPSPDPWFMAVTVVSRRDRTSDKPLRCVDTVEISRPDSLHSSYLSRRRWGNIRVTYISCCLLPPSEYPSDLFPGLLWRCGLGKARKISNMSCCFAIEMKEVYIYPDVMPLLDGPMS